MSDKAEQFHFNSFGEANEVIIRHGDALPIREPQKLSLSGDINTPFEFYEKRKDLFLHNLQGGVADYDSHKTNVVFNKDAGTLVLSTNEDSFFATTVKGTLKLDPIFSQLKVNDEDFKGFTPAELAKILRMNRSLFDDKAFFNDLVNSLQKFKAKFDTEFENSNDKRGGIANSVVKKMVSEHNYNFSLTVPVFEGLESHIVPVEVDIDYSGDAQIRCTLISVELQEIIDKTKQQIVDKAKEVFHFCPVIVQ